MKGCYYLLSTFVYASITFVFATAAPAMALSTDSAGKTRPADDTGKVVFSGWGSHETGQLCHMNYSSLAQVGLTFPRQWLMREQVNRNGQIYV